MLAQADRCFRREPHGDIQVRELGMMVNPVVGTLVKDEIRTSSKSALSRRDTDAQGGVSISLQGHHQPIFEIRDTAGSKFQANVYLRWTQPTPTRKQGKGLEMLAFKVEEYPLRER